MNFDKKKSAWRNIRGWRIAHAGGERRRGFRIQSGTYEPVGGRHVCIWEPYLGLLNAKPSETWLIVRHFRAQDLHIGAPLCAKNISLLQLVSWYMSSKIRCVFCFFVNFAVFFRSSLILSRNLTEFRDSSSSRNTHCQNLPKKSMMRRVP